MSFLVPRSVFFDTELYRRLNASNPTPPLDKLTFRQNDTSAQANSDSIQEILTGNVTMGDWVSILFLLEDNATNVPVRTALRLTNNLLLYSLPDHAVRFIAYAPPLTAPSTTYTFCTGQCGPPTAKPWWEQVWTGLLIVAAVLSAVILPINAFLYIVQILVQVGNWLWNNIVGPGIAAVKSAVQAAGKALEQLATWVESFILDTLRARFEPLLSGLRELMLEFALSSAAAVLLARSEMRAGGGVSGSMSVQFANTVFLSRFALLSTVLSVAMAVALMVITGLLLAFPFVIPVLPFIISSLVVLAFTGQVPAPTFVAGLPLTLDFDAIADVSKSLTSGGASPADAAERAEFVELIANLMKAISVLVVFVALLKASGDAAPFLGWFFGMMSLVFVAAATVGIYLDWDRSVISALAVMAIVFGGAGMVFDAISLVTEFGEGNLGGIVATVSALVLSAMAISLSLLALANL